MAHSVSGVTFAEPAIGALQAAGQNISVERAPYLYALLNDWAGDISQLLGLVEKTCHLINKDTMVHGVGK